MDDKIQTSFIPKKPLTAHDAVPSRRYQAPNTMLLASGVLFVAMLVLWGGLFGYGKYLEHRIATKEVDLKNARSQYEPANILKFRALDKRLRTLSFLLDAHRDPEALLVHLAEVTAENITYTSFDLNYKQGPATATPLVGFAGDTTMAPIDAGVGTGLGDPNLANVVIPLSSPLGFDSYQPVALSLPTPEVTIKLDGEADTFITLAGQAAVMLKDQYFKSPTFSDFQISEDGTILFSLTASVDPILLRYADGVEAPAANTTTQPIESELIIDTNEPDRLEATQTTGTELQTDTTNEVTP